MDEYITDIKEISPKKVLIFINDAPLFVLYKNEPEKLHIKPGESFSQDTKDMIFNEILYKRALNRVLGLIRTRDHTVYEIKKKLNKEYYPEDIIIKITDEMLKQGFLNDRRYAENYIVLHSSTKSNFFITQNLLKKGISKNIIEEELESYIVDNPENEERLIMQLLESKYKRNISFENEHEKYKYLSKVYAYLQRKGFSYDKSERPVKDFFDT